MIQAMTSHGRSEGLADLSLNCAVLVSIWKLLLSDNKYNDIRADYSVFATGFLTFDGKSVRDKGVVYNAMCTCRGAEGAL
jgi:hypothetical protein